MAAKRRKETTQSTALEGTEDCQQQVPWSTLSPYILETIYSFLNREDQVNMSVVCRSWSEGYGMPSVWKEFNFFLSESRLLTSARLYSRFAEKYSKHFQHVRIYCLDYSNMELFNAWKRRFVYFLRILARNSRLESIEFFNLGFYMNRVDDIAIYATIEMLLILQLDLKFVRFEYCGFEYNSGNHLFKILVDKHGKSLERLVIQKYFSFYTSNEDILDNLEEFPRILAFSQLSTLQTDYSSTLEYVLACDSNEIQEFERNRSNVLSKVKLSYNVTKDKSTPISNSLTPDHWNNLTTMFPNLRVEISIQDENPMIVNMASFIKQNMPISNLALNYNLQNQEMEIGGFFDHLRQCATNDYLEIFVFQCFCTRIEDFASFLSFVNISTNLRNLILRTMESTNAITLIEYLKENRPGTLEDVYIVDEHMKNKSDYPNFKTAFDEILSDLKFNVKLVDSSEIRKFAP